MWHIYCQQVLYHATHVSLGIIKAYQVNHLVLLVDIYWQGWYGEMSWSSYRKNSSTPSKKKMTMTMMCYCSYTQTYTILYILWKFKYRFILTGAMCPWIISRHNICIFMWYMFHRYLQHQLLPVDLLFCHHGYDDIEALAGCSEEANNKTGWKQARVLLGALSIPTQHPYW